MNFLKKLFKPDPPKFDLVQFLKTEESQRWKYMSDLMEPYFTRNDYRTMENDILSFEDPLRTYFICDSFLREVNNGGLLQFFTNSSGILSPSVSQALTTIGAEKTKVIYEAALTSIYRYAESHESLRLNLQKIKVGAVFNFSEIFDNQKLVEELSMLDSDFINSGEPLESLALTFAEQRQ